MQKHEENLVNRGNGNSLQPLSGVTVTVVDQATGLPAALYEDDEITPITSVVSDSNGYYSFKAADGKYTVSYSSVRIAVPEERELILEDPDDNPAASLAQLAASGGAALVKTIATGTGAVVRDTQAKQRDIVNIKDFGATPAKTDAENKTAMQAAISALGAANGGVIIADFDTCCGIKTRTPSTWPSFAGITKPILIIDNSRGTTQDPLVHPEASDGLQTRYWSHTPQTTSPGQHDGNTWWFRSSWVPTMCVSNDSQLAVVGDPSRTASDNLRAGFATMVDGVAAWQLLQGNRVGAALTKEELCNLVMQKFSITGDTLGDYTPLLIERKTGNMSYGGGRSIPSAHHHFEAVSGSPSLPEVIVESRNTTSEIYLRTVTGAARDVSLRNTDGVFSVYTPVGDAFQIDYTNRRTWFAGSQQLRRVAQTYGATVTIDTTVGNIHTITATNGTAFTIAAPTGPSDGLTNTITIRNTSGGVLGVATWDAVFKMAAWVQPANGFSRSITFYFDGTNWIEQSRTAADIPT